MLLKRLILTHSGDFGMNQVTTARENRAWHAVPTVDTIETENALTVNGRLSIVDFLQRHYGFCFCST